MSIICVKKTKKDINFTWDTQTEHYDQAYHDKEKVKRFKNLVIGFVGSTGNRNRLYTFLSKKITGNTHFSKISDVVSLIDDSKVNFSDSDNILISDSKKIFNIHPQSVDCFEVEEFEAIGSGADYAIGAYYTGATVKKCVEVACEIDVHCGKPVKQLRIKL
ncbi:MAG: hypothetical protein ABIA11_03290 [Patescibacteria group bacterium]